MIVLHIGLFHRLWGRVVLGEPREDLARGRNHPLEGVGKAFNLGLNKIMFNGLENHVCSVRTPQRSYCRLDQRGR